MCRSDSKHLKSLWSIVLLSMSNNFFKDDDSEMYSSLNERSELERFRNSKSDEKLQEFEDEYCGVWRPAFEANHAKFDDGTDDHPLHPWKVLKRERARYAEEENDGEWPPMKMRHALRVVKDDYVEKWRSQAYDS